MAGFFIFGIILTLLILAGAAFAWWWLGRSSNAESTKRRHREEARQLQAQLDLDPDFTRNFHRPTQNEILETLQALDHLMPGWELESATLTDGRLKNELAESFPALRREGCVYPHPIASDVARLFDHAELSPEALEHSLQTHAEEQARRRQAFHAARAHANAQHQMAVVPERGPVTLTPGSLPFRVSEERPTRRWPKWVARLGYALLAVTTVAGAVWYVATHPEFRREFQIADTTTKAPTPNPSAAPTPPPTPDPLAVLPTATPVSVQAMREQAIAAAQAAEQAEAAPTPTSTPAPTPPPPTPAATASDAQVRLAQQIAASQGRAIDKYPGLAVPNSEINLRFVFRYKALLAEKSPRLQEPDWPEKLADECANAASAGGRPKKPAQAASTRH